MKKAKGKITTILLVLVLLVGLSLLLYPTFADWWNSQVQSRAIASYTEKVQNLDTDKYKELWESARNYNKSLLGRSNEYLLSEEQQSLYHQQLNVGGDGVMGIIEIPSINCTLPIYHGTSEDVLHTAIGHLEWTSLPTGGESTHAVVSGHRGLPSATLFTNLDQLIVGDLFVLHVLDEQLTYEVDQILIVEPDDTEALLIQEGKDLVTLVTCTPYGVNSHRMLVRGHRVANVEAAVAVRITADAVQIEPMLVAVLLAVPILLTMLIVVLVKDGRKKRNKAH